METTCNVKGAAKSKNSLKIRIESDTFEADSLAKVTLLWQDLSGFSKFNQFLLCCLGIFFFYLLYGFLLELIFTLDGLKPYSWFVTLMQFGYYSLFGWTENLITKSRGRKIPMKIYILLGGLTLGTVGFSNTSLQYLNYPMQVIFKCCKLIPVMIGGILIQKKRYGAFDFLAAITMCTGLAWFTLADSYTSPMFNTLGVIMISLALICDAIIGNVQEKAMNTFNASNAEVVFYSYSLGFLYLFLLLIFSGRFFNAFYFCLNNPVQTFGYGLIFSVSGYLGVQIVLTLVKTCGAAIAATVTTCRKAVSIFLSFIFFSKPFTPEYFWSGLLVLLGIYLNVHAKNNKNTTFKDLINKCFCKISSEKKRTVSQPYFQV